MHDEPCDQYMTVGTDINLSVARANLPLLVEQTLTSHEPVYLAKRGRRVVALIDAHTPERVLDWPRTWRTSSPRRPPVRRCA